MRDDIRAEIIGIVAQVAEVPPEQVRDDALLADLDIDSLRGLRIVAEMEKRYRVVIDEEEIGKIRSMQDIFALVEKKLPAE